jgi:hypothetical protein
MGASHVLRLIVGSKCRHNREEARRNAEDVPRLGVRGYNRPRTKNGDMGKVISGIAIPGSLPQ